MIQVELIDQHWKKLENITIEMWINKMPSIAALEKKIQSKNNKPSQAGITILLNLDGWYGLLQ